MAKRCSLEVKEDGHVLEEILAAFAPTAGPKYRTESWLLTDYDSEVWIIEAETTIQIDWRVRLPDGELLTSLRHSSLWEVFRSWLIARTHPDMTGGKLYGPRVISGMLRGVLHCIDYFLLRAASLGLSKWGLGGLSGNDLKAMIAEIASNRSVRVSVYQWPSRLTEFLRSHVRVFPSEEIERIRATRPEIDWQIPRESERLTSLSTDEIIAARAWLVANDVYVRGQGDYRFSPSTVRLATLLYRDTVFGHSKCMPVPAELCMGARVRTETEFPRARVTTQFDERVGTHLISAFLDSLASLGLLRADGLAAPLVDVSDARAFALSLDIKRCGRFRTLPQQVVFGALRRAIEFSLEFGDALVDSFVSVARAAKVAGMSVQRFGQNRDIQPFLTQKARDLGIDRFSIEIRSFDGSLSTAEWYRGLRSSNALVDLLSVLYGAVQIVVGTLSARRVSELMELRAGSCLDSSRTRLVFGNCKSGIGGLRDLEARPIPPIAVTLIGMIERLQMEHIAAGLMAEPTKLFAFPCRLGQRSAFGGLCRRTYGGSIDVFADWAQLPLDRGGGRYYIRQHQLRRFFSLLFFWGNGFGGLDTLRWFLGHSDAQHLWHYITESTPGAVVRSVAAEWATYSVKHATQEAEQLSDEVRRHFGTSDVTVLDDDALCMHIEDLIAEGSLLVEPQFLDGGRSYRIGVLLSPRKPS